MKSVQKLIAELDAEMAPFAATYGAGAVPAATASNGGVEALSDEQECYNFINGGVSVTFCFALVLRTVIAKNNISRSLLFRSLIGCSALLLAPFGSRSIQHGSQSLPEESLESGRVVWLPF